jgi:uncharacterized protein YecE (DUF72 family)
MTGTIRAGVGGWTFEPWRGVFYPKGLPHKRELEHASRHLSVIEINSTYYKRQTPKQFAAWAAATPDDFVFSVKASRFCTNRKVLAGAKDAVAGFMDQGVGELGAKLGPILWQFMPTKAFDYDDFAAFLDLLPRRLGTMSLRHAVEVRHDSFKTPAFIDLARRAGVAVVVADSDVYPLIADLCADFVYVRLLQAKEETPTGYGPQDLDLWADHARTWSRGGHPKGLPALSNQWPKSTEARDVFVLMINGAKIRAPAAAQAFLSRLT